MFIVLAPVVNFTNILQVPLKLSDPKSAKKKTKCLTVFFALLGSASVIAALKMLVKSTPDFG